MLDIPGCEMVWIHSSIVDYGALFDQLGHKIQEEEPDSEITATDVMKISN